MKSDKKYVMLSFDTEEFDIPREQGKEIPLEESLKPLQSMFLQDLENLSLTDLTETSQES